VAVENAEQQFELGCEKNVATNCKRASYPILDSLPVVSPPVGWRSSRDGSPNVVSEKLYISWPSSKVA